MQLDLELHEVENLLVCIRTTIKQPQTDDGGMFALMMLMQKITTQARAQQAPQEDTDEDPQPEVEKKSVPMRRSHKR